MVAFILNHQLEIFLGLVALSIYSVGFYHGFLTGGRYEFGRLQKAKGKQTRFISFDREDM